MKKILTIGFTLVLLTGILVTADATTVKTYSVGETPDYSMLNRSNNTNSIYNNDLARVEDYLFGTTFRKESPASRLNRIERRLFNRNYANMNIAQRMNNILANYRGEDYYNRNYLADYNRRTPAQRIMNRFIGQPTGFTPSIIDTPLTPFGGSFSPAFSRGYTSNRGYGYNNSIPAMTRAGIRILD